MGVLPVVLVILAMKLPILGLLWFVFWAGRMHDAEPPAEEKIRGHRPLRPRPSDSRRGPRRRGPHGAGAVRPLPSGHGGRSHVPVTAERAAPAQRHSR